MSEIKKFYNERAADIKRLSKDKLLKEKSLDWMIHADKYLYNYNFTWLGRPIIKYPNDIVAIQELIWKVKPDLIIETGIAHGGSLILSASIMAMLGKGKVVGIDIDIKAHNRTEIERHPLYKYIEMFEGSSTDERIVQKVIKLSHNFSTIMVILDSLHTHEHVLKELELYSGLVTKGSYLIAPDTFIEYFPPGYYPKKGKLVDVGNNPMTALNEFLENRNDYIIDHSFIDKLCITEGFNGYLKKI